VYRGSGFSSVPKNKDRNNRNKTNSPIQKISRARVVTPFVVYFLVFSTLIFAQTATTSLRGTVYDPGGAVVSGSSVVLTNPATGFTRSTKTDNQGVYQFLDLPPATYEISATSSGFATTKETGIQLLVNSPGTLNIHLQVAGGTVTVEVGGTAPMVNTVNATLGHAFDTVQIADLPFEGRDPTGILSLQPGVAYTGNSQHISSASDSRSGAVCRLKSRQ